MSKVMDHVAVVTGVSNRGGIGAAICRTLANDGAHIFFTHFAADHEWTQAFQKEIQAIGVKCEGLEIDLSEANAARTLFEKVRKQLGIPTILVNNAAHSTRDSYLELNADILDRHYAVNMRGTMLLSVEFAQMFEKSSRTAGRIINITSGQAQGPMINELAYVATKGAISAFTLSLSAELAPLGITVNAVNPGPTDSGWMTEQIKKDLLPKFLMGRIGLPQDAANLVAFLASTDASWITGQVINSEGGFLRK